MEPFSNFFCLPSLGGLRKDKKPNLFLTNNDGMEDLDVLFGAAVIGDDAAILRLIRQGLDVNYQDAKGESPLHWAAQHGNASGVKLLLEEGANPNITDKRVATPLHFAADQGHDEIVAILIRYKANVNAADRGGSTPLHWAVSGGKQPAAALLLDHGADINIADTGPTPVTALHLACYYGREKIARFLIQRGATVSPEKEYAYTPLHSASEMGHLNLVELLIENGADVNKQDESGFTPLHLACKKGHKAVVGILLRRGGNLELKTQSGKTAKELSSPELLTFINSPLDVKKPVVPVLKRGHQRRHSTPPNISPNELQIQQQQQHAKEGGPPLTEQQKKGSNEVKLVSFLKDIGLENYTHKFLEQEFDMETMLEVKEQDLIDLGLKIGSRRKLLAAIQKTATGSSIKTQASRAANDITFNEIQLTAEIGSGFYGTVFRGVWNGTFVAVKKISPSKVPNLDKWLLEVDLLSELRHPNVVVFYGACTTAPNFCIITEWVQRGSLYQVLEDTVTHIDYARALSFALDTARGLNFLHSHDPPIIHRDLKSENLLVTNNWRVKLTDFGLSRYKDSQYSYLKPSLPFDITLSAPEVLESNHISEKADVYSYALILWELWTRRKPFAGKNPHWVAKSVLSDEMRPPITADFPTDYGSLIKDCWDQNHRNRPACKDIIARLEAIQADHATDLENKTKAKLISPRSFLVNPNMHRSTPMFSSSPSILPRSPSASSALPSSTYTIESTSPPSLPSSFSSSSIPTVVTSTGFRSSLPGASASVPASPASSASSKSSTPTRQFNRSSLSSPFPASPVEPAPLLNLQRVTSPSPFSTPPITSTNAYTTNYNLPSASSNSGQVKAVNTYVTDVDHLRVPSSAPSSFRIKQSSEFPSDDYPDDDDY